ncbi:MAG: acetate--CoA ligase family protein [Deltaproteobacteria bacterium]|nr:acetate--CoA ligase family protein [Deltaproteobacteria bacterium]
MITNKNGTALSEHESKKLLKQYNIPVVDELLSKDADDALKSAEKIGFPVVIKGAGASLLHKTERGLVHIHLTNKDAVQKACDKTIKEAGDDLEGFLVQPYIEGKREFVAGMFRDQHFGPVIMFGLGGVFTEALLDVTFRVAPLTEGDAGEMLDQINSKALLGDFRGEKTVARNLMIQTLTGLSQIAVECPDISEIDINPLLITPEGKPIAVDALVIKDDIIKDTKFLPPIDPEAVGALFYPKSVAFIGASGTLGKWGYTLLTNVISGGFEGEIYLVNPKGGTIAGKKVYRNISEIPGTVDVAVVTIPAAFVPELIPEFKEKGIKNMLLIASGFAETGEEGRKKEEELIDQARKAGVRIIGPNTMGICNPHINFYCSGTHFRPKPGSTSILAQSGNMGNQLLAFAELQGIGIRCFCGSGNEAMITIEDYLDAFEVDAVTEIVMLYIESFKNGRRFLESARRVSRKKPIVLLKGGQTKAGNRAALSHTGALSSDTRIFNAVCKQAGIVKVEKPMDLLDLSAAFSSLPLPKGNRVAIMTLGGGWGVVTADLCEAYGLEIPELSKELIKKIDRILPPYWSRSNPIDLVGENDMSIPMTVMKKLLEWDGCDAVINLGIMGKRHMVTRLTDSVRKCDPNSSSEFLDAVDKALAESEKKYAEHIVDLMEQSHKPALGVSMVMYEEDNTVYPVKGKQYKGVFYPTPEQAVKSLSKMYEYHKFLEREESSSSISS